MQGFTKKNRCILLAQCRILKHFENGITFLKLFCFVLFCVVLVSCVWVFYLDVCLYLWRRFEVQKVTSRYSGFGVAEGCDLPYGWWESNPGLLEEHAVLLTTEPSTSQHFIFVYLHICLPQYSSLTDHPLYTELTLHICQIAVVQEASHETYVNNCSAWGWEL